jgi:hypothetical protein
MCLVQREERAHTAAIEPAEDDVREWCSEMGPICRRCCSRIRHDAQAPPTLESDQLTMGQGFRPALPVDRQRAALMQPILSSHKPHTRENGVRKLNQLLLRRFRIPGRRDIRAGVNPIEPVDLRNSASWRDEGPFVKEGDPDGVQLQFVDLTCEDLPPGFVFDQFGLMVRCLPGPLVGLGFPGPGLGGALESISDTTSTEEEAGVPPAAANMSTGDADPVTPPTAVTTPASSNSELSTPLSFSLDSPPDDSFNAIETRPRSTAKSYNNAARHTSILLRYSI